MNSDLTNIFYSQKQSAVSSEWKAIVIARFDFLDVDFGEGPVDLEESGLVWAGHPAHGFWTSLSLLDT